MKLSERKKVEKLIQKIETDSFDANDVDLLIGKLREYAPADSVFKEIAHYLAHNRERDRGITRDDLNLFSLTVKFLYEYKEKKRPIDLYNLPIWVKQYMIARTKRLERQNKKTLADLGISAKRLKQVVESRFKDDKENEVTIYKKAQLSSTDRKYFDYLLPVVIKVAFTTDEIFTDLISLLKTLEFNFDERLLSQQKDKISLCIIHIMDNTVFSLNNGSQAKCNLGVDKLDGIEGDFLCIAGGVRPDFDTGGKDITVYFTLLNTSLKVEDWVDSTVLNLLPSQTKSLCDVSLDFWKDLYIDSDFKLTKD